MRLELESHSRSGVLVLHEPGLAAALVRDVLERLGQEGRAARAHELSGPALASDRCALEEGDRALAELRGLAGVDPRRLAVLGLGRGGTLAFLLGCARRLAAVVDVGGPVLHPALSGERPIQPLELALNFEGAFLGVFARDGAVGGEEQALLAARLMAAARPFELVEHDPREGLFDGARPGYDARGAEELWSRVRAFLAEHLAAEPD